MAIAPKKIVIPVATLAVLGSVAGASYLLGFPPFDRQGEIKADRVCESLGESSFAATALRQALPAEPTYSFKDQVAGENAEQGSTSYTADCFVRGESSVLLSARTEMMVVSSSESWTTQVLDGRSPSDVENFTAGSKGVASASRAAVLVPCTSAGRIPGGSYSLSVVIDLRKHDDSDERKVRQALENLAVGAAEYSHREAKCDLPSRLPQ
ncbi:hypothetical protein ACWEFL_33875 [Streptomyces sp. NPDC004838]